MALKLNRRTVLRGIGGAVVGLPVLECMLDSHGEVLAQSGGAIPRRYGVVFAGQSIGGDNYPKDRSRINGQNITEQGHFVAPAETGASWTMTTPLQPLENLRSEFSVVTNMRIPYNVNSTDGSAVPAAGAYRDFHGGASSPLLSGVRSTQASFRAEGPSSDQVVAGLHTGQTRFPSLVYRAQPSWYLAGGSSYAGRQYISYRAARDPIPAETSPQQAWNDLFDGFQPAGAEDQARQDFWQRARLSVLDKITSKRQSLVAKVGQADRIRLERHFDEIRTLEERIRSLPPVASGECQVMADPGADPQTVDYNPDPNDPTSSVITPSTGYSNEDLRASIMADLIHMAFVCDLTRVASLQLTVFQSHMNVYQITTDLGLPILTDLHEVGHNGDPDQRGQRAVSTILQWHITHYAYLLEKLRSTPEGAGTVLDNCSIVFMPEGGHGLQLNDGGQSDNQTHSVENMVMLVGGRAGDLNPGRHIRTNGAHPGQCLISAMQGAGYTGDTFGEVTGNVPEMFT